MQPMADKTCVVYEMEDGTALQTEEVAPLLAASEHAVGDMAGMVRKGGKLALLTGLAMVVLFAIGAQWPDTRRFGAPHVSLFGHPFENLWADSSTLTSQFRLTQHNYTDSNHVNACVSEFGSDYRIADWVYDIIPLSKDQVVNLCEELGINKTFNAGNFFVSKEGQRFYSGSRSYFFERHDGHPPSNWLVHDVHSAITLGSWFGISGPVLCAKKRATDHIGMGGSVDQEKLEDFAYVTPNAIDVCGDIPATQVFDVQWSGNEQQTDQRCSGFDAPFDPSTHTRFTVDQHFDHYRLGKRSDGSYVLQHFDRNGKLARQLSGGEVKLANSEAVFYIINGWFATIITKSKQYTFGDAATFNDLSRDPVLKGCDVAEAAVHANTTGSAKDAMHANTSGSVRDAMHANTTGSVKEAMHANSTEFMFLQMNH